jgi:demethylmenaquinone methyltransferase/2-methoxy-6-polyprenyl-1,4-benzoquinol methylase
MTEAQSGSPASAAADIYEPAYIMRLFDEMSHTYGVVNYISSFGFSERWRRQCAAKLNLPEGSVVLDLMSGMGEMWPALFRKARGRAKVIAVELSQEMCKRSKATSIRHPAFVVQGNALTLPLASNSVDAVVSAFGLKTFSDSQKQVLAGEIARVLKPGGTFSLVEISVPPSRLLRLPYMFYIRRLIPFVGRLFMGNPQNYRMLGVYTERFGNSDAMFAYLREAGLAATTDRFFFGCATGVHGHKPRPPKLVM